MDENDLCAIAAQAMEEAGLVGLCREGQLELARERLMAVLPVDRRHRVAALLARAEQEVQAAPP
jgi:hypothetical protein